MKKLKLGQTHFVGAELLSRSQLKKITGGAFEAGGCTSSSQCPSGQYCCSDYSNPAVITYSCDGLVKMALPDGSGTMACPSLDPPR